jgi:hypothetical protein
MRHRSRTLFVLTGLLLVAAAAFAQPLLALETGRTQGGHTFMPTGQMHQPFVVSYVRSGTGLSIFAAPLLNVEIGGNEISLIEGNVLYLTQEFEYQLAVNGWLAVRAGGSRVRRF